MFSIFGEQEIPKKIFSSVESFKLANFFNLRQKGFLRVPNYCIGMSEKGSERVWE